MLKSPLAQGGFYPSSLGLQAFFSHKGKKSEAPKCLALWSLAANEMRFHRGHFFLCPDYSTHTVTLRKALYAKRFRFRECFSAESFDCAAFDEEFDEVVHCLGRIPKRRRIATIISRFLTFFRRLSVLAWQEQLSCQGRKNFFCEKRLDIAYGYAV